MEEQCPKCKNYSEDVEDRAGADDMVDVMCGQCVLDEKKEWREDLKKMWKNLCMCKGRRKIHKDTFFAWDSFCECEECHGFYACGGWQVPPPLEHGLIGGKEYEKIKKRYIKKHKKEYYL